MLLTGLAGCGDSDLAPGSRPGESQGQAEGPVGDERPDPVNRSEGFGEQGPTSEPMEPAVGQHRSPAGAPDYVGIWAADPEWCDNSTGAEVPIEITEERFGGYENTCTFTEVTEEGARRWGALMRCTAEGTTEERRITMEADENKMILTYHDIEDRSIGFRRCAREP